MARVAVVVHRERAEATELALDAVAWLEGEGHEVRVPEPEASVAGLARFAWPEDGFARGLDLAVSVGGDGTMLRAVDLVGAAGVPVLGVHGGHLGYLTEVEPPGLHAALGRFFAGDHGIEERMTLEVAVEGGPGPAAARMALNEAWLEKIERGHTVRIAVSLGGRSFLTYVADGLIVATATGSTAYNLSARGPILSPGLRALVLTPVSPHMLFDRSLVLDPSEPVRLELLDGRPANLFADGRPVATLESGQAVTCRAGRHAARLVTFGHRQFHGILKAKFGLAGG